MPWQRSVTTDHEASVLVSRIRPAGRRSARRTPHAIDLGRVRKGGGRRPVRPARRPEPVCRSDAAGCSRSGRDPCTRRDPRGVVGDERGPEPDQLDHPRVSHLVVGVASGSSHLEQAAVDQAPEVRRNPSLGETRVSDALIAGSLAPGAEGKEGQAGRVAQGAVETGEQVSPCRVVRHRRDGRDRRLHRRERACRRRSTQGTPLASSTGTAPAKRTSSDWGLPHVGPRPMAPPGEYGIGVPARYSRRVRPGDDEKRRVLTSG